MDAALASLQSKNALTSQSANASSLRDRGSSATQPNNIAAPMAFSMRDGIDEEKEYHPNGVLPELNVPAPEGNTTGMEPDQAYNVLFDTNSAAKKQNSTEL